MAYLSDDEITDIKELLARFSEAIGEKCSVRTEFLRNTLSVERIVQRYPVSDLEEWMIQELEKWDVSGHPQVAYVLSLSQELWPSMSSSAQVSIKQYCESNHWNGTNDILFNQLAAEISEGYLL